MELFASPMACSLASHITALEAGLPVKLRFVKDHKTDDGGDFYSIAANGYVPALRLDDGTVLNEGASVLQYLADAAPEAGLAPAWGTIEREHTKAVWFDLSLGHRPVRDLTGPRRHHRSRM